MSYILSAIPIVLGIGVVAKYVGKLKTLLSEVAGLLTKVNEVLADNAVSNDEIAEVIKEAKDIVTAVLAFGKK